MDGNEELRIPEEELHWTFARSGGPGGQNVNKVASKAVLHWDFAKSNACPDDAKVRLAARQRNPITTEGQLVIQGQRFRDQAKNVEDCRARLHAMIQEALTPPTPRKATRPSYGPKMRRLTAKTSASAKRS